MVRDQQATELCEGMLRTTNDPHLSEFGNAQLEAVADHDQLADPPSTVLAERSRLGEPGAVLPGLSRLNCDGVQGRPVLAQYGQQLALAVWKLRCAGEEFAGGRNENAADLDNALVIGSRLGMVSHGRWTSRVPAATDSSRTAFAG